MIHMRDICINIIHKLYLLHSNQVLVIGRFFCSSFCVCWLPEGVLFCGKIGGFFVTLCLWLLWQFVVLFYLGYTDGEEYLVVYFGLLPIYSSLFDEDSRIERNIPNTNKNRNKNKNNKSNIWIWEVINIIWIPFGDLFWESHG